MGREELHGVLAVRQHHADHRGRGLVDELHRTLGRTLTSLVAVKHADDARDALALHEPDVIYAEGRPQRRHRIGEAGLVHGDDVGVALADDGRPGCRHGLLGAVVGKEVLALVEDRGVTGVEVLGRVVGRTQDAAAKGDGPALLVVDGEHRPVVEPVGKAPRALHGKVGGDELLGAKALPAQVRDERAASRRVAKVPATAHVRAKAAPGKVCARGGRSLAATTHEHGVVVVVCQRQGLDQAVLARPAGRPPVLGKLDARAICQVANGVRKREVLALHHVLEDVAALAARAKAMPQARCRVHLERGGLLVVEGAASPELAAALAQLDRLAHQLHDVGGLADPLLVLVADHATTPTHSSPRFSRTHWMFPNTTDSSSASESNRREARRWRRNTTRASSP